MSAAMASVPFPEARRSIVAAGRWLDAKGWAPATAGNYSMRVNGGNFAITVSGTQKGRLTENDVMVVDARGEPLDGKRPSAETRLHMAIYRASPETCAVLHSHSPTAVALTRAFPERSGWEFSGHEMLKVFPGISTHDASLTVPIVDNSQDMAAIERAITPALLAPAAPPAYLIRGHGLYGWGRDMIEAERMIEAVEWLVTAELAEIGFRNRA